MKDNPIGKVTRFQAEFNFNHNRWARPYGNCKKQDVDWEAYLMKDRSRPFDARMLRQWHLYKEFSTGLSGLWMVHLVDACQMIMSQEFPATSDCTGGCWVWTEGREHCDTFSALLTYPAGFLFNFAMSLCNSAGGRYAIFGTDGTLDLNTWKITGAGGGAKKVKEERIIKGVGGTDHMLNWLECLRSRKQPNAPIRAGYSHAVACLMTAHALWTGRRKTYDPKTMQIRDA
jgi:predicted dehydrogenase